MNMKLWMVSVMALFSFAATAQAGNNYGASVKTRKALKVNEMKSGVENSGTWQGVVTGSVKQVCKAEGCWLKLDDGSKDGIMVKMKDHSFLVPKDIEGKTVYVYGKAIRKTTSVKELQHYAEDAGKTKEEIAAITSPKVEIQIEALGVKVMQ